MTPSRLLFPFAIASMAFAPVAQNAAECSSAASHGPEDIVTVASEAGQFQTLLAAAKAAGLVSTLKSEGPFTVFAPTDDAFAALPEGTLEFLLANPDQLADILTYHVVSGAVTSDQVPVGLALTGVRMVRPARPR